MRIFKKKKKFMVIGIDGVPYELLKRFADEGVMPNVKRLMDQYSLKQTRAPLPEVSSVSWASFMTGKNPGEHGVFGFTEIDSRDYSYIFPYFPTFPAKPVWEIIGTRKKRSIIINLPGTYPIRPMRGMLISGFVAPELEKSVYPVSLLPILKGIGYRVDVDASVGKDNKPAFLKDLFSTLNVRYGFYQSVVREEWDLFFFIITGTDRLHHFLFNVVDEPGAEFYGDFLDYYRRVDTIIGEIAADMEMREVPFIILSDHGFVKIKKEVYLSQYLKEWGYLDFGIEKPGDLESITAKTRVFALDPSRLYIHLEGKYKRGRVRKDEYDPLREEIKSRFLGLEIDGEKVMESVYYKEEIYSGPYMEKAPDLVLVSRHGFDLKSGITKNSSYGKTFFEGMHSMDNAVLIDSYGFELDEHPNIYDIGRKLIEYF
jgi:predicted AlkP superfamily phosphohydrolase/phosphomutase